MFKKIVFSIVVVAALAGAAGYFFWPKAPIWAKIKNWGPAKALAATVQKKLAGSDSDVQSPDEQSAEANSDSSSNWDGTVQLTDKQIAGVRLQTAVIHEQTEPTASRNFGHDGLRPGHSHESEDPILEPCHRCACEGGPASRDRRSAGRRLQP